MLLNNNVLLCNAAVRLPKDDVTLCDARPLSCELDCHSLTPYKIWLLKGPGKY